jgi:hypothetical protein
MKYIAALTIIFLALVSSAVLLSVADKTQGQPQQLSLYYTTSKAQSISGSSGSVLPSTSALLETTGDFGSVRATLDNDLDNDSNHDGIADLLAALGSILVVLSIGLLLRPLIGSKLLLVLREPPKLSSVWPPVLEQPG